MRKFDSKIYKKNFFLVLGNSNQQTIMREKKEQKINKDFLEGRTIIFKEREERIIVIKEREGRAIIIIEREERN